MAHGLTTAGGAVRITGGYGISGGGPLVRLDASKFHHLGPLLGFGGDEGFEIGWGARKWRAAKVGKPCLNLRIGEASVDLLVELVDDFGGRALRPANTAPVTCLETRHEI